ncbi:plancitoxin-1-like [Ixodes scapularis]|uniref:plancitoxin-1-like n=1 Tax=Ixodes scapularis TaxID=6945 RepID=UPI001A9DEAAA|nr:plancitoxin-1-like [Ixodes scapularis]
MWYTVRDLVAVFILLEIVNSAGANSKHNVHCKNEKGKDVDWFVMYKLPKMQKSPDNYVTPEGEEIAYYDSNSKQAKTKYWTRLTHGIYNRNNPVAHTLKPLYEKQQKIKHLAYVAYNDQAPEGFNGTKGGHSKGILMVGASNTVWLQHSVPRFPILHGGEYSYPKNGRENAQLFLCVTFSAKDSTDIIAQHLRVQYANVYQKHAPLTILNKYPKFKLLYEGVYVTRKNESLFNDTLRSLGRQRLQSIAKRGTWKQDIYAAVVAPYIVKDNLYVESWRNGAGKAETSFCRKTYSVMNVKTVIIMFGHHKKDQIIFSYREDHSKWAVAEKVNFFCFSSLNRMESQYKRGGEVTCMENAKLAHLFRNSIKEVEMCDDLRGNRIPEK